MGIAPVKDQYRREWVPALAAGDPAAPGQPAAGEQSNAGGGGRGGGSGQHKKSKRKLQKASETASSMPSIEILAEWSCLQPPGLLGPWCFPGGCLCCAPQNRVGAAETFVLASAPAGSMSPILSWTDLRRHPLERVVRRARHRRSPRLPRSAAATACMAGSATGRCQCGAHPHAHPPLPPAWPQEYKEAHKSGSLLCHGLASGGCRFGAGCRFSHDIPAYLAVRQSPHPSDAAASACPHKMLHLP